jgi:hypothetical protein
LCCSRKVGACVPIPIQPQPCANTCTHPHQPPTYLSTYLIHPLTLSFPSHHLPPSLSHTSLRITPHLPTYLTRRPNTTPHHSTPSVPQPSEQAHQAHQARRQPSPSRHARTCTPARLQRCAPAQRSVRVRVRLCRLACRERERGECKIAIGAAARRGASSGVLRCVALRVQT